MNQNGETKAIQIRFLCVCVCVALHKHTKSALQFTSWMWITRLWYLFKEERTSNTSTSKIWESKCSSGIYFWNDYVSLGFRNHNLIIFVNRQSKMHNAYWSDRYREKNSFHSHLIILWFAKLQLCVWNLWRRNFYF